MLRARIRTPTDPEVVRDFTNVRRVTFGRASDNDLVLEGTYVSRLHGELLRLDTGWCGEKRAGSWHRAARKSSSTGTCSRSCTRASRSSSRGTGPPRILACPS